jgi:hypothetical protein
MIFAAEAHSLVIGLLMIAMLLDDRPLINKGMGFCCKDHKRIHSEQSEERYDEYVIEWH